MAIRADRHLSLQAYERLGRDIAQGRYAATDIIREIDVAREYNMSRTPIREALKRLHGEDLVRPVAPGGFVVVQMGPKEVADLYKVREALVGLAAGLAAVNRSRVHIALLEDALENLERACKAEDVDKADDLARHFFHTLAEASENTFLPLVFRRVLDAFIYKPLAATHPECRDDILKQLRDVVEAVESQDAAAAERFARENIANSLVMRLDDRRQTRPQGRGRSAPRLRAKTRAH